MMKILRVRRLLAAAAISLLAGLPTQAAEQRILATVNDKPITTMDVEQHMRLSKVLLGDSKKLSQAAVLDDIINEVVKLEAARSARLEVTPVEVDRRIADVSKNMKLDRVAFEKRMLKEGIGISVLRRYFGAQMAFARLLQFKYRDTIKVDERDVDKKEAEVRAEINGRLNKVMADPRMRTINVYSLQEIEFPVENPKDPGSVTLLQSRAAEANQFVSRYKGCKSAKAAASGIFNVKINKTVEADAERLPKPLRKLIDSKGPGNAYGPMRSPNGIQVVGFCGKRTIKPPKPNVQYPTREQVKQAAVTEKFKAAEKKYVALMRKNIIIEFKNQAAGQD
jgi:peptidyl-prolyl cis-trans isomerase SurA